MEQLNENNHMEVIANLLDESVHKFPRKNANIIIASDGYSTTALFNDHVIPNGEGLKFRVKPGQCAEFDLTGITLGVVNGSGMSVDEFWEFVSKILGYTVRAEREDPK